MKRFHIAISTDKIAETVAYYNRRRGVEPCVVIPGDYALWRTDSLNVSIRLDEASSLGTLRHLGWEDPAATAFAETTDVNGIVWEQFNADHQAREIKELWPETDYQP